ncbi:MAG: SurA N-terminal domain-containing protein [Patescibacteria group bacterium]|nr:SurA N-terminal domain-containing protein [Patescibacteria group bacterium]
MNIKKIIFIVAAVLIISAIFILYKGYWPAAFVGFQPITYAEFQKAYGATSHFYESSLKLYNEDPLLIQSDDVKNELKRAVLDSLIENKIIDKELSNRYKPDDLEKIISEKIGKTDMNLNEVQKGSEILYGLSPKDFKEVVLITKAKQEILEGNLFGENKNYDIWIHEEKLKLKVKIFISNLYWDKAEVKLKAV